ncbi:MAG: prolyl-tRNA synthetase associated domain-containing protein [Anaerocolumna aminovalerica]|jgi:Ala-tRNA(Pro) deacylase|uniref:prolyl-tRNA synthetase associated domain-containing protein n=1 Tax=Anaerocolumna aminovalerica TaxID=1527 RepID=UPI000BE2C59A|nr:prolyl-tRNA synthetase associated domain-containing protein [Anaerocolumna aminovalerica]MDU6266593.1 prolyl-tRNA synthetase associated domain-containing protein [Anaerocolumna aminovalerica]
MENILYLGRPLKVTDRLEKEIRVYDLLDELGISYQRVDHEALATMDACQEVDRLLEVNMCKNLFLSNEQKTKFYLLLMPGDKKFKTKDLSKQIGSARLSFGSYEDMEKYLDITPGSVSIMGVMNDKDNQVQLLLDEDITKEEYLACHPCINTSSIKIKMEDVLKRFLPAVGHEPIVVNL